MTPPRSQRIEHPGADHRLPAPAGPRAPRSIAPRAAALVAAAAALALAPRPAAADDNVEKADALFAEGVRLRDSNLELACAKFGESLQLNPQAIGVLLNVAMCDERHGRVASAVRRYRETRERAREQSFPEYLKAADAKLEALTPLVPYLTIRFEEPPAPQTKVVVDDQVVPLSALGDLPLDPGERTVVVSAPGRIAFERKLTLATSEHRELSIPPLQRPSSSARPTIGKITLAAGGAAVATSVVLGFIAHRRYDRYVGQTGPDGAPVCPEMDGRPLCSDGDVYAKIQSARQLGNVATIVGVAGAAAALAGGYLWYFAPRPRAEHAAPKAGARGPAARPRAAVRVVPELGPAGGGLSLVGRF